MGKRIKVSDEQIVEAAKNSLSGAAAAVKLGIKYDTFRVHAKRLGVFNPNPSGKGITKPINDDRKFILQDILEGTGLTSDDFTRISALFGSWKFECHQDKCELYLRNVGKIEKKITKLYNERQIRYGSW